MLLGTPMAPQDGLRFWLWVLTVATAVAAGLLAVGATLRRRAVGRPGAGSRMMLASYACMSASMLLFAARGLL